MANCRIGCIYTVLYTIVYSIICIRIFTKILSLCDKFWKFLHVYSFHLPKVASLSNNPTIIPNHLANSFFFNNCVGPKEFEGSSTNREPTKTIFVDDSLDYTCLNNSSCYHNEFFLPFDFLFEECLLEC